MTHESGAGIVVQPGDAESLAKAITYLYQNPEVLAEMGGRGREFILKHFSYEALKSNLVHILNGLY